MMKIISPKNINFYKGSTTSDNVDSKPMAIETEGSLEKDEEIV